jgi:hypothetical protein
MNWRARRLFDVRNKFAQRLRLLAEYQEDTSREPGTLTTDEMKDLLGHLEPGWFEKIIVNKLLFQFTGGHRHHYRHAQRLAHLRHWSFSRSFHTADENDYHGRLPFPCPWLEITIRRPRFRAA